MEKKDREPISFTAWAPCFNVQRNITGSDSCRTLPAVKTAGHAATAYEYRFTAWILLRGFSAVLPEKAEGELIRTKRRTADVFTCMNAYVHRGRYRRFACAAEAGQAARVLNIGSQPALAGAYLNGYRVNGAVRRPAVFLCQLADGVVINTCFGIRDGWKGNIPACVIDCSGNMLPFDIEKAKGEPAGVLAGSAYILSCMEPDSYRLWNGMPECTGKNRSVRIADICLQLSFSILSDRNCYGISGIIAPGAVLRQLTYRIIENSGLCDCDGGKYNHSGSIADSRGNPASVPVKQSECKPSGGESLAYRFLIGLYGNLCREEEGSAVGITDIIVIVSLRKRRCPVDGSNMITAGTVVGWAAVKRPGSLVSGKDRVRPNLQPAGLPEGDPDAAAVMTGHVVRYQAFACDGYQGSGALHGMNINAAPAARCKIAGNFSARYK